MRRARFAVAGLSLTLLLFGSTPFAAPAATPAPSWKLSAIPLPSNFTPGAAGTDAPSYFVSGLNIGSVPSQGAVELVGTLPDSLTPTTASLDGSPGSCAIDGRTISCATGAPVPSGGRLELIVSVEVSGEARGYADSEFTLSGGGAATVSTRTHTALTPESAQFGFLLGPAGLSSSITAEDGGPATQSGATPYLLDLGYAFASVSGQGEFSFRTPAGGLRDLRTSLPPGLVVYPAATPRCTEVELVNSACPPASQVGTVSILTELQGLLVEGAPVYNVLPPPGSASNFGFAMTGIVVHLLGGLRSDGDFRLFADASGLIARYPVLAIDLQLWGDPASPGHDAVRGAPVEGLPRPLLRLPSACGPLSVSAAADSWEGTGQFASREAEAVDGAGNPFSIDDCTSLEFWPELTLTTDSRSTASPTGLRLLLHLPQGDASRAQSSLRRSTLTLPPGFALNLAAVEGLAACSPSAVDMGSAAPATCPDAAKLGRVEVKTPLLGRPLSGAVYLAAQEDNPFRSLIALYLVIEEPLAGVIVKLPGEVHADPATGQLGIVFDRLPQLPFEDLELELFGGPRAVLRTPPTCGDFAARAELDPWSGGAPAQRQDRFVISISSIGACPATDAERPRTLDFTAGSLTSIAGHASPFVLRIARDGDSQELAGFELRPPPGLTASLASIADCPEAVIAIAANLSAAQERDAPSCPRDSRVGQVIVTAGAGSLPFHFAGKAYLAGPYHGAPISLAVIVPALAGPFDFGTVSIRVALHIDPATAQIHAVSDPYPTILHGIPLEVRSFALAFDRPGFTINPSSCDPMQVDGVARTASGQEIALHNGFQVGACAALPFRPDLTLRLSGGTGRNAHPTVTVDVTPRPADANLRATALTLPYGVFFDPIRLRESCTRSLFAADHCPASSRLGWIRADTSLLAKPERGRLFLVEGAHRLPDLAASLGGRVDLDLHGHLDTRNGRIRATFNSLPDVPLSRLSLVLKGGFRGILVNSRGLCSRVLRAAVTLTAHNAKRRALHPRAAVACSRFVPSARRSRSRR
jgi:hypothetical protein